MRKDINKLIRYNIQKLYILRSKLEKVNEI